MFWGSGSPFSRPHVGGNHMTCVASTSGWAAPFPFSPFRANPEKRVRRLGWLILSQPRISCLPCFICSDAAWLAARVGGLLSLILPVCDRECERALLSSLPHQSSSVGRAVSTATLSTNKPRRCQCQSFGGAGETNLISGGHSGRRERRG